MNQSYFNFGDTNPHDRGIPFQLREAIAPEPKPEYYGPPETYHMEGDYLTEDDLVEMGRRVQRLRELAELN